MTHIIIPDRYVQEEKITDENVSTFLLEVFYGVLRYQKLLQVTVNGIFGTYLHRAYYFFLF